MAAERGAVVVTMVGAASEAVAVMVSGTAVVGRFAVCGPLVRGAFMGGATEVAETVMVVA